MREIYVPGRGTVTFPASMSDDEIRNVIQSKFSGGGSAPGGGLAAEGSPAAPAQRQNPIASQTPAPKKVEESSFLDTAGRYAGLAARGVANAVAAPGLMIADGMMAGVEALTGFDTGSTPSKTFEKRFLDPILPKPVGFFENLSSDVVEGVSGAGLAKAATKGVVDLSRQTAPALQKVINNIGESKSAAALSAAASSTASQVVQNAGGGEVGQAAAGLIAGVLAPTTGIYGVNVLKNAAKPYTQSGKEEIVGGLLNSVSTNPKTAMENLELAAKNPQLIPGSMRTTAGASRDVGLAAIEQPISSMFDTRNRLGERKTQRNQARTDLEKKIAGDDKDVIQAKIARDTETDVMRESAFAGSKRFIGSDLVESIAEDMQAPGKRREVVDEAFNFIKRRMSAIQEPEFGTVDPKDLYGLRQDLREAMEGKLGKDRSDFRLARGEVGSAIKKIDNELEAMAPGYKEYMKVYANRSKPIEEMEALQEIFSRAKSSMTDINNEQWLLGSSLRNSLDKKLKEDDRVLSPKARAQVELIIDDINEASASTKPGVSPVNSATVKNLSIGNLLARSLPVWASGQSALGGTLSSLGKWLYTIPEARIQELMVEAMLDPAIAANLMKKADKATMGRTMEQLRTKAMSMGLGTFAGTDVDRETEEEN